MLYKNWIKLILVFGLLAACQSEGAETSTPIEPPSPTQVLTQNPTQTDTPKNDLTTPIPTRIKGPENLISMRYGETIEVNEQGIQITFLAIVEDSRCPMDVTCVWEGRVTVELGIEKEGLNEILLSLGTLSVDQVSEVAIEGVLIKLFGVVQPYPISTISSQAEEYVIYLLIEGIDK